MSNTNGHSNFGGSEEKSESERVEDLYDYNILDIVQGEEFDAIARLASKICDTRISMINLIGKRRQWTKSSIGIEIDEIPREQGICRYTILDDGPLEASDLTADDRFKDQNYVFDGN